MAKRYEFIREIFNSCSGNQMRDVFIEEIESDDIEAIAASYRTDAGASMEKTDDGQGTVIYNILNSGLPERLTFSEIAD
jgi:hypothetical protein